MNHISNKIYLKKDQNDQTRKEMEKFILLHTIDTIDRKHKRYIMKDKVYLLLQFILYILLVVSVLEGCNNKTQYDNNIYNIYNIEDSSIIFRSWENCGTILLSLLAFSSNCVWNQCRWDQSVQCIHLPIQSCPIMTMQNILEPLHQLYNIFQNIT